MRKQRTQKRQWQRWLVVLLIPITWVGQSQVKAKLREPQALLVLGGDVAREQFAASFARQHPELEIWVSSGTNPEYAEWLFHQANISRDRLHLDYRAVDTVTNFTTLVADLKAQGVESVYLVTSDYHMRRASIIAQVVLGRHDIAFHPLPVPSAGNTKPEPLARGLRDGARAVLWLFTGQTGSTWKQTLGRS